MKFEQLRDAMPDDVHEAFDPLAHKSANDLAWLCMHLLDLSDEGEIHIDRKAVKKYRDKCTVSSIGVLPYLG